MISILKEGGSLTVASLTRMAKITTEASAFTISSVLNCDLVFPVADYQIFLLLGRGCCGP